MSIRWSTTLDGQPLEQGVIEHSGLIEEVELPIELGDGSVLHVKVNFDPPVAPPVRG